MSGRSQDDYAHERQALDAAHAQNEAGRDAFVALAHTALFAASVSFVGDVAPLAEAIWKPVLIAGWSADVTGLLALTLSFGAARRTIDARRAALNDVDPPGSGLAELLNAIALWSFPVALLCLFSFVTANVVHIDDKKVQSTTANQHRAGRSAATTTSANLRAARSHPAAASTNAWRAAHSMDWCHSRPESTVSAPTPCATSGAKKINAIGAR